MPRNIEIKARVASLDGIRSRALVAGAHPAGTVVQVDRYTTLDGAHREKLREIAGPELDERTFEWIRYDRPEGEGVRGSDYVVERLTRGDPRLAEILACPVVRRVDKRRELLLWENVRIHLDRVEGLGDFVELEAVVDADHDEARCRTAVDRLLDAFGVEPSALVRASYSDLIAG